MHTLAPVATAQAVDLISPARAAGWLGTEACLPGEFLCGAVKLYLGSLPIPVRLVVHDTNVEPLLERLAADMQASFYREQYVVLHNGFTPAQIAAYRARLHNPSRRLHVGDYQQYCEWLCIRLGQLGRLRGDSHIRRMLECFLTFSQAPRPTQQLPLLDSHQGWRTEESFRKGTRGTRALQLLFEHVRGVGHILNVEQDPKSQVKGVDFHVCGLAGGRVGPMIALDVKTEDYFRNLSVEDMSNLKMRLKGWFWTSEMQVLVSVAWPSGEVYFLNFEALKEWILSGRHKMEQRECTSKGQDYYSLCWLLPISTVLFDTFDDAAFLSLADWLPEVYGDEFKVRSIVPDRHAGRKLVPQR